MTTYNKVFFCIASNPFLPSKDGTYTFITRAKDDPPTDSVKLFSNHDYELGAIGTSTIHYVPCYELLDGRHLCLTFAQISTNADLVIGQGVSVGFGEIARRGEVRYGDAVAELSIADIPSTPLCNVCEPSYIADFMKQIRENKFVLPNFAKLLKSIGEKTA
jgi:hypothetical protein